MIRWTKVAEGDSGIHEPVAKALPIAPNKSMERTLSSHLIILPSMLMALFPRINVSAAGPRVRSGAGRRPTPTANRGGLLPRHPNRHSHQTGIPQVAPTIPIISPIADLSKSEMRDDPRLQVIRVRSNDTRILQTIPDKQWCKSPLASQSVSPPVPRALASCLPSWA